MAKNGWQDLVGTIFDYFRVGFTGPRLKNSSGVLQIRDSGDTADANLKAALLQLSGGSPGANKVLTSDASGNGSWSNIATLGSERVNQEAFTQATTSPLTIFTPNSGEIITKILIEITAAAAGGSPTLAVGITGTTGAYMATTDNNPKEVGVYSVEPLVSNAGVAVILTIVPSSQTFTGTVTVFSSVPG